MLLIPIAAGKARLSTRWTSAGIVVHSCRIKEELHVRARPSIEPKTAGRLLATALGLTAVLAIATSAAQARPSATNLSLVAYSTPAGAFGKIIPAFQKTAAGKDVTFKQSYGSLRPAGGRGAQRPAGRRREPLARARHVGALAGRPDQHELEQGSVRRHGHRLDRRVRRAQGQSRRTSRRGPT